MSRKIIIDKYQGNTHYSVHVIDSFGQEHHLGYLGMNLTMKDIDELSEEIWSNEVKREISPMEKVIHSMVETGKKFLDERGNHRDGLD
jgi:hypothetical protein